MTGLSPIVVRCFLASCCLLIICRAAPAADEALVQSVRTTTEATPVTTEELEFKDVPIFEKDKPRKPAPGTKVVAVLKCKNKDGEDALETTASESSDGQRSQDQKESHETIHDPSGTTAKDAPRVPPTGQQIRDKEQHQLVPDAQTDSIVGVVVGAEPTPLLAAAAQAVPADDGQATSSAKVEKSETEALDAIADVKITKDESIPVEDKLTAVSRKPAKGSEPSKPAEAPSSDKLAEELIKTAPVVKEDAKKETTIIADEDNEGKIAAADAVLVTPTEELKPESQVVPVASVGVKEKDSSIILESTKSDVVVSDDKKETTKITDFVPVVSANSEKTDKVVALVDISSETLSASASEQSKLAVDDSKTTGTITADATKLDDKKDVSKDSDSVPAVSKVSEKPEKVVALVDISSEILTSVPEKSDPAVKTPIEEPKPDSQVIPLISDKVKVETEKLEESSISSTVEQAKSDATKSDDKKDVSKDSDSVPSVSKISEKPDKVVILVDVSSETLLESALDKTDLVDDDSQTAVTTPINKGQNPESQIIPLISDEVKVETEKVKENLISSAVKPAKSDATKSDDKKEISKDSDSVATLVDVSSEILSASAPEKSKLDVDSQTVVTTPIEKQKPESQVVPLLSDEGIKVETEKVKGSSVSLAVEPVKSDASKSDDKKEVSEDSDSILAAVSTTSEKLNKVVALVDISSEILTSIPEKSGLVVDSQTAVSSPTGEKKPESQVDPLNSNKVKVELEKIEGDSVSSAVKPAKLDVTESDDKKEISATSDSVPDVSAVSDDKTVASINVAPETPASIQKKANSTINAINKDDFETNFESTNAIANKEEGVKDFTGYKVYRVIVPTEEAARWILKFEDVPGIEFWADPKLLLRPRGMFVTSAADILVAPDVAEYIEEALRQARLPFEILIKDVQDAIRNENPSEPVDVEELTSRNGHSLTWERYHSLEDIYSYLDYLKVTFPDFVTVTEIGRTTENRPIKAIRLSQKSSRSDKKAILIDAGIHAREWITPATITYMIREIVDNPTKYNCIMNEFDWLFVPVLNPDGYAYTQTHNRMWRKTRSQTENIVFRQSAEASLRADRLTRFEDDPILDDAILEKLRAEVASNKASLSCTGADANRNFDYHWLTGGSSRNPCSDTFAGAKPFSEPEARALRDLVMDNKDQLSMYISLHAYSQMWLIPWGFKQQKPDDFSDLYSLAKVGSKALETVNGVNYLIGSIPDLLYIASGSSIDWVKGAVGVKYSYTLELRDSGRYGFLLPANQIIPSGKETWIALYATAVELSSRVYTDSANCPAV